MSEIEILFREYVACPKCANRDISARHVAADKGCGRSCHPDVPEHMLRRCERCRFSWRELPLDTLEEIR